MRAQITITDHDWRNSSAYFSFRMRAENEQTPENERAARERAEPILLEQKILRAKLVRASLRRCKERIKQTEIALRKKQEQAIDKLAAFTDDEQFIFDQEQGPKRILEDQPASGRRLYRSCRAAITRILNDYYGSPTMSGAF